MHECKIQGNWNATRKRSNEVVKYLKKIWTDCLSFFWFFLIGGAYLLVGSNALGSESQLTNYLSPTTLTATSDGTAVFIGCSTANRVLRFETSNRAVSDVIEMPAPPLGMALSPDDRTLYVTCAAPESKVCIVDVAGRKITGSIDVGHTAMAPIVSPNGKKLYVCNRFNNDVSVIDLVSKKEIGCVAVEREPVAAAITKDGRFLLVANLLQNGRADVNYVAASVSVIDTSNNKVVKQLQLPNGSDSLNDIRISPDGRYAVVPHIVGRFSRLTSHVTEGWINANALTLIELTEMKVYGTMLLDDNYSGASNPWGVAWSPDNAKLVVTHAGTHEVSVIDFQKWLAQFPSLPLTSDPVKAADMAISTKAKYEVPDDLPFFAGGCRVRVKLADNDLGPRAAVVEGNIIYIANYFSDTLSVIDLINPMLKAVSIPLGPNVKMDLVRKGEFYFYDAGICYEKWQSCASCHPGDARVDGLNWDLLNDGVGNPKNTRSLLLSTKTSPLMSLGVRADAEAAVRAGIQHILYTSKPRDGVVDSIVAYLQSLKPVPSPYLVHGKLSKAAERGRILFSKTGCIECHSPGLYTDLHCYDVGTQNPHDRKTDKFYTPTLIEVWRTAPYLHDGSAATIRDVIKTRNKNNLHGNVSDLSDQEVDDLCAYVLSL